LLPLSVVEQDRQIRRDFPDFRLLFDGVFVGAWEGTVTPIARAHSIGILYYPRLYYLETGVIRASYVTVRVLSPTIGLDPRGTGERPPHIYVDDEGRGFSICLYDPRDYEWSPDRFIAETIIPWACEWLFYYEGWLHNGEWAGGGNHPRRSGECPTNNLSSRDPLDRSLREGFNRIGRLTGTFASSLSMEVASAGCSLPECLRILRQPSAPTLPSSITSISSLELRPAEFWRSDSGQERRRGRYGISICTADPRFSRPYGTIASDEFGSSFATIF
jgi:hypothetical protein